MPSKLGLHISKQYSEAVWSAIERMQPSVAKVFDMPSEMNIDRIRAISPGTLIVYRQYTNLDYHSPAEQFFAELQDSLRKLKGRGIVWEGVNEPIVGSVEDARALNAWTVGFARVMHAEGERVAGFSWSTGNPKLEFVALLEEASAACDYHAYHEYYSLHGKESDWMRYKDFEAALPGYARRPVIITEAGLDDNGDANTGGYRKKISDAEYMVMLEAYDEYLMQDSQVVGATIYQTGDYDWPSFELAPMLPMLADYVQAQGGGAWWAGWTPPTQPSAPPVTPPTADLMQLSATGLAMLKGFEGLRLSKYPDGAGFSIGYGHYIKMEESFPETITEAEATALLVEDVTWSEHVVRAFVKVKVTQPQFDALVSLVYNIGSGNFRDKCPALKYLNAGNIQAAGEAFMRHVYSQGKVLPGLVARRAKERALFLGEN